MMNIMKKRSMRRIFAGILCMGVLFTGAVPCSASAPLGYDEYGDPIVTATPVPDAQTADSSGQAAAAPLRHIPATIHRPLIQTLLKAGQQART